VKKLFPLLAISIVAAAAAVAGCKGVDWFPNTTASSQSSSTSTFTNTTTSSTSTVTATTFTTQCGVAASTLIKSNAIVVTGVTGQASVSVSGGDSKFSVNDSDYRTASTLVSNGSKIVVEHTSAAAGAMTTTLTIGSKTLTFTTDTTKNSCS